MKCLVSSYTLLRVEGIVNTFTNLHNVTQKYVMSNLIIVAHLFVFLNIIRFDPVVRSAAMLNEFAGTYYKQ